MVLMLCFMTSHMKDDPNTSRWAHPVNADCNAGHSDDNYLKKKLLYEDRFQKKNIFKSLLYKGLLLHY